MVKRRSVFPSIDRKSARPTGMGAPIDVYPGISSVQLKTDNGKLDLTISYEANAVYA
jgi:hypothetical protein